MSDTQDIPEAWQNMVGSLVCSDYAIVNGWDKHRHDVGGVVYGIIVSLNVHKMQFNLTSSTFTVMFNGELMSFYPSSLGYEFNLVDDSLHVHNSSK